MPNLILSNLIAEEHTLKFHLSGSKSIAQRALIINYLQDSNPQIKNLSNSIDTTILYNALYSKDNIINIQQSGTAMRFLLSLFALEGRNVILIGDSLYSSAGCEWNERAVIVAHPMVGKSNYVCRL